MIDKTDITTLTSKMIKNWPNIPDLEVAHLVEMVFCPETIEPKESKECLKCKYYWGKKNDNTVYCSWGHEK